MNTLRYRWRLWKLQRKRDSLSRRIDKKCFEAKKSGAWREKLEEIWLDEQVDLDFTDDEIHDLETRYLL